MKLKLIPAGEFMMGSAKSVSELSRLVKIYFGVDRVMRREHPQHRVSITQPYYLSVTEVTQSQWDRVMNSRPWSKRPRVKEGADFPATYVSWDDAKEFCSRLSQEDGRNYRLPCEAEWEYACRAQTTTIFSFGDDAGDLLDYGWFEENADKQNEDYAHRVARQKANPWGLYDVHGNVWEWCSDWYGTDYYATGPLCLSA
jgi:formylglycine-generating enzyme required for sulfatase activity